jgi:hypothetical protein
LQKRIVGWLLKIFKPVILAGNLFWGVEDGLLVKVIFNFQFLFITLQKIISYDYNSTRIPLGSGQLW